MVKYFLCNTAIIDSPLLPEFTYNWETEGVKDNKKYMNLIFKKQV